MTLNITCWMKGMTRETNLKRLNMHIGKIAKCYRVLNMLAVKLNKTTALNNIQYSLLTMLVPQNHSTNSNSN